MIYKKIDQNKKKTKTGNILKNINIEKSQNRHTFRLVSVFLQRLGFQTVNGGPF